MDDLDYIVGYEAFIISSSDRVVDVVMTRITAAWLDCLQGQGQILLPEVKNDLDFILGYETIHLLKKI